MTRLVNVFLRGAADGLSLLVPIAEPAYYAARPTQAVDETAVLDVGIDGFGLHPAARQLAEVARSGHLALVPAAGYGGQTRSHFQSQAILESAVDRQGVASTGSQTGWLGSILEARSSATSSPFRGVAIGSVSVPPSLWGTNDSLGIPDPTALRLGSISPSRGKRGSYQILDAEFVPDPMALQRHWDDVVGVPDVARSGVAAASAVLDRIHDDPIIKTNTATFGDGPTAATLAAASAILDAGLGTEVVQIDLGGWDTHKDQGTSDGVFADLLASLDAGIGALFEKYRGAADGVVISVLTEFGRRVQENASGGTDHGRGGLALILGDHVAGGLHGTWPGLDDLDSGDVRAVNDLRVVQSEVAQHAFGLSIPTPDGARPLELFSR